MENDNGDITTDVEIDIYTNVEIDIEEIIAKAIKGDQTSLNQLMASPWLTKILGEISTRYARQFGVDGNEINGRISDKLRKKITTIENLKKGPLTRCLKGWCRKAAKRFCMNQARHREVEDRYIDRVIHENSQGTRKSPKGTIIDLQPPATSSPEEIMLQQEEHAFWAARGDEIHARVYHAVSELSPKDFTIIRLWAEGLTLKETEEKTGIPLSTVQRRLKKSQKQIIEHIGIANQIADDPKHIVGAFELITNCMLELNRHADLSARAG